MTPPGNSQNFDTLDLPSLSGQSPGLGPAESALLQLQEEPADLRGPSNFQEKFPESVSRVQGQVRQEILPPTGPAGPLSSWGYPMEGLWSVPQEQADVRGQDGGQLQLPLGLDGGR